MSRIRNIAPTRTSALAAGVYLTFVLAALADVARGQVGSPNSAMAAGPYASLLPAPSSPYPVTGAPPVVTQWPAYNIQQSSASADPNVLPTSASWIVPVDDYQSQPLVDADVYCEGQPYPTTSDSLFNPPGCDSWGWQVLPDGLIYHSYLAGVHESRIGVVMIRERDGRSLWDATVGGRAGLLRYGTGNPMHPEGWELDVEGAAMPRLTLDRVRDLETVDFRAGALMTYGVADWQFKFGYYHLSSHLGDEFAIANPGSLANRINYVRDSLVLGASYYVIPVMRLYGETAWATNRDGGADPWEFQFGTELSQPGPTGPRGTPFLAVNTHLREENDFSGDITTQAGWLWRGLEGQTMRIGLHYFNGKSSQYQTFNDSEEQIGVGLWYDY